MNPVTEYLKLNSVKSLEQFGIYCHPSKIHSNRFGLNYDQIDVIDNELSQNCRGTVLIQLSGEPFEAGEYRIVSRPFKRFFNHGQGSASTIDWNNCFIETKEDGSLLSLYYFKGKWIVSTRSVPDADIACSDGLTFAQKFWRAVELPDNLWVKKLLEKETGLATICFEYTSYDNQIVVAYDEERLTLLAIFDNEEGFEVTPSYEICEQNGYRRPKTYPLNTLDDIVNYCNSQPGISFEGVVAVDRVTRARVKIKNLQYLALAKVLTKAGSNTGLMTLILGGTIDDVKPYLPKPTVDKVEKMEEALRTWIGQMDGMVDRLRAEVDPASLNPRKDAAMIIKGEPTMISWVGILLDIWTGRRAGFAAFLKEEKKPSELEKVTETILARI